ncbi:MAG: 16S rRNA (cytosine(1402)-N(4))-methyltransferase RsmH [Proteobacteria bacterium]|nr:16S rRNA (cytosine(1402)-N(4))-methyltransferase RsmH [Pseudomonadota bacterium]
MLKEVLEYLSPKKGETYVDGTFGAGGYTKAILKAAECKVIGIDRDPYVEVFAAKVGEEFTSRFTFIPGKFSEMQGLLAARGIEKVDGVVLDVGVSSMQIDTPRRGFSFMHDGPLDMRMSDQGESAADVVNSADEAELANIIYRYGGERFSRKIARAIVEARTTQPFTRTLELADLIRRTVRSYNDKIDPATRTFQALRIWVNNELSELSEALVAAEKVLSPGGRIVVVSFHSEEDAIVKGFLQDRSGKEDSVSRYMPIPSKDAQQPSFKLLSKKALKPTDAEVDANVRSRSAKLRAAERTSAPAWVSDTKGARV